MLLSPPQFVHPEYVITDCRNLKEYSIEVAYGVTFLLSFMQLSQLIQNLKHREHGNLISVLSLSGKGE
jgi:hypothetical protein